MERERRGDQTRGSPQGRGYALLRLRASWKEGGVGESARYHVILRDDNEGFNRGLAIADCNVAKWKICREIMRDPRDPGLRQVYVVFLSSFPWSLIESERAITARVTRVANRNGLLLG